MFPRIDERYRELGGAALVGAGYWALASYSLALPVRSSGISYIWPADGLALGVLLCTRPRSWAYYLAAAFLGNFLASNKPFALNLLYSSFNVFEPWLVATVVTKLLGVRPAIASVAGALRFILLTVALMAAAIFITNSVDWLIFHGEFWKTWIIWFLSNTVGMLVIAPLLVAFSSELRTEFGGATRYRWLEAAVLVLGLVITMYATYAVAPSEVDRWAKMSSTPMLAPALFLIWGALRFAMPGGTLTLAILALMSFWYTANGSGPFVAANQDAQKALIHLQVGLSVLAITVIIISAVATEWRHALAESRATKKKLDRALESARLALFEVEVAAGRAYLSEGWAEMTGAPRGETHTTLAELLEIMHPEERDLLWEGGAEIVAGERDSYETEHRVRRRDGQWIWVLTRCRVVERDAAARALRVAGTSVEVTERKLTEQRLHYLATRDALTDLTNRALFGDGVQQALDEARRWQSRVAIISVGLDRFTAINDSLGQQAGDLVLKFVAVRLKAAAGGETTVARPGGDEFLVLLPGIHWQHEAAEVAENIRAAICKPMQIERHELVVTASVGVAIYPDDADSPGMLLRNADIALHNAKDVGRDNVQFFAERMNLAARSRLEKHGRLRANRGDADS